MLPTDNLKINKCKMIAAKAHDGQYRRDRITPYIEHCYAVAERVSHLGESYICVALLHDVLEDTATTAHDLIMAGVDADVIAAVQLLTKHPNMDYDLYLKLIKINELACRVKIADMLHNLSDKPTKNQIRKYAKGLLFLTE